jgi:hypothetical protein
MLNTACGSSSTLKCGGMLKKRMLRAEEGTYWYRWVMGTETMAPPGSVKGYAPPLLSMLETSA